MSLVVEAAAAEVPGERRRRHSLSRKTPRQRASRAAAAVAAERGADESPRSHLLRLSKLCGMRGACVWHWALYPFSLGGKVRLGGI